MQTIFSRPKFMATLLPSMENLWRSKPRDIVESRGWRARMVAYPDFARGVRNLVLQVSTDGVPLSPDRNKKNAIWPVESVVLNSSPDERFKPENILLHGVVSGPLEPKSMEPYLALLVDDFTLGWDPGFDLFDTVRKERFLCRVMLQGAVADLPGVQKITGRGSNVGLSPCSWCFHKAHSVGTTARGEPPRSRDRRRPLRTKAGQAARMRVRDHWERSRKTQDGSVGWLDACFRERGIKGRCAFDQLVYFDSTRDVTLDMMHAVPVTVGDHMVELLRGNRNPNVPKDPRNIKRRGGKWGPECTDNYTAKAVTVEQKAAEVLTRQASVDRWRLRIEQVRLMQVVCDGLAASEKERDRLDLLYHGVEGPASFCSGGDRGPFVLHRNMKMSDWLMFTEGFGKYLVREALNGGGEAKRELMAVCVELLDCLTMMCSRVALYTSTEADRDNLDNRVRDAVRAFMTVAPDSESFVTLHSLVHAADQIYWWGPASSRWMFPYERFIGTLKRGVHSTVNPEATIMHKYRLQLFPLLAVGPSELLGGDGERDLDAAIAGPRCLLGPWAPPGGHGRANPVVVRAVVNGSRHHRRLVLSRAERRQVEALLQAPVLQLAVDLRTRVTVGGVERLSRTVHEAARGTTRAGSVLRKVSRLDFAMVPARALRAAVADGHVYLPFRLVPPKYASIRYFAEVRRVGAQHNAPATVVARLDMFATPPAQQRVDEVGNDLVLPPPEAIAGDEDEAEDTVVMVLASELGRMVAIGPQTPSCPHYTVLLCHPVYT